jgi:phage shock protein C
MSRCDAYPRRRFYRNRDHAVVAGVCAGIADYFGFNRCATRFVALICLFVAMPVTLIIYFATVMLVPAAPARRCAYDDPPQRKVRPDPSQTVSEVRRRYESLDSRLARLERYVTSSRYQLDQEFRNLR